jgi:hypothetical protein
VTVKEMIHQLIDELPDAEAERVLAILRSVEGPSSSETEDEQAKPLWGIAGIGRSGRPSDIANHKDDYLADAYATKPH